MQNLDAVQLQGFDTQVELSAATWGQGITKISVHEKHEIPFLLPALSGHHFFTGVWPRPAHAIEYEPHECPGYLIRHSDTSASYHQPTTPYSKVETRVDYTLADTGTIDIVFTTTSHASEYPFGYVGLFWGAVVPEGGQRGFHTLVDDDKRGVRWMYFAASGDATVTDRHTILGPGMEAPEHDPQHPRHYYFAQSGKHFALPIQVGRWRDLAMILELDDSNVVFTDVLMATAIGGPSWDVYWLLKPGETRRIRCRLTVDRWRGWEHVEERYRDWPGCVDPKFSVSKSSHSTLQEFRLPQENEPAKESGLALSKQLFEKRGRPLLEKLGLLSNCSVACLGGSSQNAGLDDEWSRDHIWGPYLTFVMDRDTFAGHGPALKAALSEMPDEVDGIAWTGYDGPEPRKTRLMGTDEFLHLLTRASSKPYTDKDWIPLLSESSFLGCRWTETMFDATQGAVFHDPGKRLTMQWRHRTGYPPPNVHRAILARSLFRLWNAGPEYNLLRAKRRDDFLAYRLCLDRFTNEAMELAFCWNERYVPQFKWRAQQFRRLPMCPVDFAENLSRIATSNDMDTSFAFAAELLLSVKKTMKDLYHVCAPLEAPLSVYAHEIHGQIDNEDVKAVAVLDW